MFLLKAITSLKGLENNIFLGNEIFAAPCSLRPSLLKLFYTTLRRFSNPGPGWHAADIFNPRDLGGNK